MRTRQGSLPGAMIIMLALVAPVSRCQEGCLVLPEAESRFMHEYGSERVRIEVLMAGAGCTRLADRAPVTLFAELDGDEFHRELVAGDRLGAGGATLLLPMMGMGAHSLVVVLEGPSGDELDSVVYPFFTPDWRPALDWAFPPEAYVFKRNSQRFVRFGIKDLGDHARCQEGAMSCLKYGETDYHVSYSINGQPQAEFLFKAYVISLSGLPAGRYTVLTEFSDVHRLPLGINHTVTFDIDSSLEYTEDGEAPAAPAPCPETECSPVEEGTCFSCGAHGDWRDGACVCVPDWTGARCEHHMLSSVHYLPTQDPAAAPGRCSQSRAIFDAFDALRLEIDRLQHPPACFDAPGEVAGAEEGVIDNLHGGDEPGSLHDDEGGGVRWRVSVVRVRGTNGHAGLASFIEQVAGALSSSIKNSSTLVLQDFCDYFFHRGCPARQVTHEDMGCYFEPLFSGCSTHRLKQALSSGETHPQGWEKSEVLSHLQNWRPAARHSELGIFWWNSLLLRYIVSPNRRLQSLVARVKSEMGWLHPIIGAHIRRGDSCNLKLQPGYGLPLSRCKTVAEFMPHIRNMSLLYGVRNVFVTSDSVSVYKELPSFEAEGFNFIFSRADRSFLHHDWLLEMRLRMALVDRKQVAEASLIDVLLLSEADYLIGGLQSGYTRLALSLSSATKGFVPPYVSMDYPWTPRFGLSGPYPPWKEWWDDQSLGV